MKIPVGIVTKITGFALVTHDGKKIVALHDEDFAYIEQEGHTTEILVDDKAREVYNQLYKRFPK